MSSAAEAQSGNVTVAFRTAPDYENPADDEGTTENGGTTEQNPGDNLYQLRITSDHNLHDLGTEGRDTGCDGSAVDITVRVKDVGKPIAPPDLAGQFKTDDDTRIDLTWSPSDGFTEDSATVPFPHPSLETSKYEHQRRWGPNQAWTDIQDTTATSEALTGLDRSGYIVRVRAVNSEGEGEWSTITVGTLQNEPPTITAPANVEQDIVHKFPDGRPAILRYDAEPGASPGGAELTYVFRITLPGQTEPSPLADGLLSVTRSGNNFEIRAAEETTPAEYAAVYGDAQGAAVTAGIYASDGTLESEPRTFTLTLHYEASAYFDDADERDTDQRYTFAGELETYEGPAAGSDISLDWSTQTLGTRTWAAGNPASAITCRDNANTLTTHTWPDAGAEDSARFAAPAESSTKSGTIDPAFKIAPDFENPADADTDNVYLVRFHNTHDLHNPTQDSTTPSCSGSAADLAVRVKDVGPPVPVADLTGDFKAGDSSIIQLSWTKPPGFEEDGTTVSFPHSSQDVTGYTHEHRSSIAGEWTSATTTSTSVELTGLDQTGYQIRVRAANTEGDSPWAKTTVGTPPRRSPRPPGQTQNTCSPSGAREPWSTKPPRARTQTRTTGTT